MPRNPETQAHVSSDVVLRRGARVLFLDDMEDRHKAFRSRTIGVIVDHVHTAAEAIRLLATVRYDAVFLDHDLKEEHYAADTGLEDPTTGYAVAKWMAEREWHEGPPVVIAHSMNPVGCFRILNVFHPVQRWSVYQIPFHTLLPRLRVWSNASQET